MKFKLILTTLIVLLCCFAAVNSLEAIDEAVDVDSIDDIEFDNLSNEVVDNFEDMSFSESDDNSKDKSSSESDDDYKDKFSSESDDNSKDKSSHEFYDWYYKPFQPFEDWDGYVSYVDNISPIEVIFDYYSDINDLDNEISSYHYHSYIYNYNDLNTILKHAPKHFFNDESSTIFVQAFRMVNDDSYYKSISFQFPNEKLCIDMSYEGVLKIKLYSNIEKSSGVVTVDEPTSPVILDKIRLDHDCNLPSYRTVVVPDFVVPDFGEDVIGDQPIVDSVENTDNDIDMATVDQPIVDSVENTDNDIDMATVDQPIVDSVENSPECVTSNSTS